MSNTYRDKVKAHYNKSSKQWTRELVGNNRIYRFSVIWHQLKLKEYDYFKNKPFYTQIHLTVCRYDKNPSWWNHQYSTVPARRKERDLLMKLLRTPELADMLVFPDFKKPVVYYW